MNTLQSTTPLGEAVTSSMRKNGVTTACYVADHLLAAICDSLDDAPDFTLLPVAREDEGLGILAGAYLAGSRGAMLMQSSGFALCANVLGSLLVPYQIPVVMFVGLRGDLGEFNVSQVSGGQAVAPTCQMLGIPYWAPVTLQGLERILDGAFYTAFSTKTPVCIGIRRSVTE